MDDSSPTIRRARKRDRSPVADLWTALLDEQAGHDPRFRVADDARERFENDFPVWLDDDTQRTLVAEAEGGVLVGFATAHRQGAPPIYAEASEVFVDELYVLPGARGSGTGRCLARALRTWAEELEADRLRLRVLHRNEAGRAFWQRLGADPLSATMTIELEPEKGNAEAEAAPARLGF